MTERLAHSSASQYGEHEAILKHFAGRIGTFLDIGALDGVTISNTRPLADLGWSGVCVEPSPQAFAKLMQNYAGNDRITLVNAAIVPHALVRLQKFHVNTVDAVSFDAVSTLHGPHRDLFAGAGFPFREIMIPVLTPQELIVGAGLSRVQFLNIDVEGLNLPVTEAVLDWLAPEMACIEIDPESQYDTFRAVCARNGLTKHERIGGNLLAIRQ